MEKRICLLLLFFGVALLSCTKPTPDAAIVVTYNWTASLQYYNDDLPVNVRPPDGASRTNAQPINPGGYTYNFKLSFEQTERSGFINLTLPAPGYKRNYMIGIYNYSVDITYYDVEQ